MSPVGSNIRAGSTVFSTKEVSTTSVPDEPAPVLPDAGPPALPDDVVPLAPDELVPPPHAATATPKAAAPPAAANRDILMRPPPTSRRTKGRQTFPPASSPGQGVNVSSGQRVHDHSRWYHRSRRPLSRGVKAAGNVAQTLPPEGSPPALRDGGRLRETEEARARTRRPGGPLLGGASQQPRSRDDITRLDRRPGWLPDVDPAQDYRRDEQLAAFQAELDRIRPAADAVPDRVDHRLLRSALARVRWEAN